ncbi:hypothetical protein [Hoeflea sp.]|nr:hypothetical protein [Hoeflea sp.]
MMGAGRAARPGQRNLVRNCIKVMRRSQAAMNAKMAGLMIA